MNVEPLSALLEPAGGPAVACAGACTDALRDAAVPGARLLAAVPAPLREDLAPTWAALALADAAPGAGRGRALLGRLAAEVEGVGRADPEGPGGSTLATALRLAHGRGLLVLADLRAAVAARRTELDVATFPTRGELSAHLVKRGRVLPRLALRRLARESERRLLLLESGVLASELARGLASQGRGLEHGRLLLTNEDLARLGVDPTDLARRPTAEPLRRAFSEQAYWARRALAKAWALPPDLGWRRAAGAAAWLRGTEERLRALERAGFDLMAGPAEPTRAALELAWLRGATWWLPPRAIVAQR